jgi:hypothetical protein
VVREVQVRAVYLMHGAEGGCSISQYNHHQNMLLYNPDDMEAMSVFLYQQL